MSTSDRTTSRAEPGAAETGASEHAESGAPESVALLGVLADRDGWKATNCSIDKALSIVGTRSAVLIMREAYYGTRRFDDFASRVGITEAVAAARLKELTEFGLLVRHPYQEPGQRTRYEYRLTDMGRGLLPAVLALMQWGDRYLADPIGGPIAVSHAECGEPIEVQIRCAGGHQVPLRELTARRRRARQN